MKLLIDVGNTATKFVLYHAQDFERVTLDQIDDNFLKISQIVYAKVKDCSQLNRVLAKAITHHIPTIEVKVRPEQFDIKCGYPIPENLGVDRWLAILGAQQLYPNRDLIIVDAGTAMTVDVLSESGRHLGGWITPGFKLMEQSIVQKAPGVFSEDYIRHEMFGTNTPAALQEGCINALVGTVKQAKSLLEQLEFHSVDNLKIILTGGDAPLLAERLNIECATHVESYLVFEGLRRFTNN